MARRDEGAYSPVICDRGTTKPTASPRRKTARNTFQTRSKGRRKGFEAFLLPFCFWRLGNPLPSPPSERSICRAVSAEHASSGHRPTAPEFGRHWPPFSVAQTSGLLYRRPPACIRIRTSLALGIRYALRARHPMQAGGLPEGSRSVGAPRRPPDHRPLSRPSTPAGVADASSLSTTTPPTKPPTPPLPISTPSPPSERSICRAVSARSYQPRAPPHCPGVWETPRPNRSRLCSLSSSGGEGWGEEASFHISSKLVASKRPSPPHLFSSPV
jgi:hypothetical protein